MANRFWVGGTGSWDAADTTHWSATTGGAGGASVPGASDAVFFDVASGGGTVTVTATVSVTLISVAGSTTLNTNGQTISATLIALNGASASLQLGASVVNLSGGFGWAYFLGALSAASATFNLTADAFVDSVGGSYGTVNFTPRTTTGAFTGSFTVGALTLTNTAVKTMVFTLSAGVTVTGLFTATGNSATNRLLIQSNTVGSARTITAGSVSLSNVDFMDITGAGAAAPFTGTSLGDCLGNSGITFTASATQYWKTTTTGTKTWSTAGNWFLATNGGGGAGRVPLPQDDVVFDANSIGAASTIVQTDMPRLGRSLTFTGVANSPTLTNTTANTLYGSLTLAGITPSGTNALTFGARSAATLTSAGKTFTQALTINAPSGTVTLSDALITAGAITLTNGTLNDGGFAVTVLSASIGASTTLTKGAGTWTLTGSGAVWTMSTATITDSGVLKFTDATVTTKTFAGGGKTYNLVWFAPGAGTGTFQITGSNTFGELRDGGTSAHSILFTAGTTQTIGTWSVRGNSGALITIGSITAAGHTLSKASGTVAADYLSISRSTATGGASWYAGANSTDGGNNSGWIFAAPPWGGLWVGGGLW